MKQIQRDIVSALLISKDNKLFQGRKDPTKGGVYNDCWHIPGGGIDEGEDKLTALQREILEETGVNISQYNIELIDDIGKGESIKTNNNEQVLCKMSFYVYKVILHDKNAHEIQISLDDDLVEYQWTDIANIGSIKLTPPSIELFTRLGWL